MFKKKSDYINTLIALAAMTGCLVYLLRQTWLKWGDLIVDTFREFWVAGKILEGHVLYRDIFYTYGFFPPYLQALLFKIFGVHLHTLVGLGIVITVLTAAAIYQITRLFASVFVAALTVIIFFLVFGFNHYFYNNNFNYILPYSFASTLCLLCLLYALYFFLRFQESGYRSHLGGWAACLSLAMFCRVELPLLAWSGFLIVGFLTAIKTGRARQIRFWMGLFLPLAIGLTGYTVFLSVFQAGEGFRESVLGPLLYLGSDYFQALVMGTENVRASLTDIVRSTLLTLGGFALLVVSAAGMGRSLRSPLVPARVLLLLPSLALALPVFVLGPLLLENIQYNCLSLLLPLGLGYATFRAVQEKTADKSFLQMMTLFLLALLLGTRVLLNMTPAWYGFYLLVPGLIGYHLLLFNLLPSRAVRLLPGLSRRGLEVLLICLLLLLGLNWWGQSAQRYEQRTARMVSEKGSFDWFANEQTRQVFRTVTWLRRHTAPTDTVVVFPEGVGVNFFADRNNPLPYCNFLPPVMRYIGQDKLIRTLAAHKVDYVIVAGRTAYDYGKPFFGKHYAGRLHDWVLRNYRLERTFGGMPFETEGFGIAVYRRIKG